MFTKTTVFVLIILVAFELDDDEVEAQPEPQSYIPPPPPLKIPEGYQMPNGPEEVPPFCAKDDAETDPVVKKCCKAILEFPHPPADGQEPAPPEPLSPQCEALIADFLATTTTPPPSPVRAK